MRLEISWILSSCHRPVIAESVAMIPSLLWTRAPNSIIEMFRVEVTRNWPAFRRMVRGNSWRRKPVALDTIRTSIDQLSIRRRITFRIILQRRWCLRKISNYRLHVCHLLGLNTLNCHSKKVKIGIIHLTKFRNKLYKMRPNMASGTCPKTWKTVA